MSKRRTTLVPRINPETLEEELRVVIEQGVNVFGFAGVLNIVADEASERVTDDDDSAQPILDAIETAIEEIESCEECEGDEDAEDDEDFDEVDEDDE